MSKVKVGQPIRCCNVAHCQGVEFGDEALVTYRSWEGDAREEHPDQPRHVPLPPSRGEHEKHLQRMEIFSKALSAHPLGFQSFIERQVPQS